MNQKDLKIISHLRKDARMPLTKMSRKIQMPVSTIFDRLKQQEQELILKHTCLLNFNKMGYTTRANILLKIDVENKDQLKDYLVKHELINSVYRINNGYDYMVEGIFKQIKDMEDFIENLKQKFKIKDLKQFYIIDDLKREEFMAEPNLINYQN
jgi:DNA-binding Lrp family transcriptional regulator